jgi:hypothetical protein
MRFLRGNSQHYVSAGRDLRRNRGARARRFSPRNRHGAGVRWTTSAQLTQLPRVDVALHLSRLVCAAAIFNGSADASYSPASDHCSADLARGRTRNPGGDDVMAKGQQRSNRETKKPKKDKIKTSAAAPSRKDAAWQPEIGQKKK